MHVVTDPVEDQTLNGSGEESKPQVRTLLLTDLCDSTMLVEKLGDAAAAELFREHDRLVLGLQQRWHGRLIDRSDGLMLLRHISTSPTCRLKHPIESSATRSSRP